MKMAYNRIIVSALFLIIVDVLSKFTRNDIPFNLAPIVLYYYTSRVLKSIKKMK